MIKLASLLKENDIDYDELENLEGIDSIFQYLNYHNKTPKIVELGNEKYIIWDDQIIDPEFPRAYDKTEWMYKSEATRLVDKLTGMIEDKFNQTFWLRPEALYHYTKRENVEGIRREGLKTKHISRGLANKHINSAVFTSTEPEWASISYGPVQVLIRTDLMKKDRFMPYVTKEPNHTQAEVMDFIAGKIGAWEPGTHDLTDSRNEGTTEDTVIIYSSIPPKYLEITE